MSALDLEKANNAKNRSSSTFDQRPRELNLILKKITQETSLASIMGNSYH